jgi:hypothetical protein
MEGQFSYQGFDLLIEPDPPGSYRARVLRSPAGECAPVQFTLPFSGPERPVPGPIAPRRSHTGQLTNYLR